MAFPIRDGADRLAGVHVPQDDKGEHMRRRQDTPVRRKGEAKGIAQSGQAHFCFLVARFDIPEHDPAGASHSFTEPVLFVRSSSPEARVPPLGENTSREFGSNVPLRTAFSLPVAASKSLIVSSSSE